MKVKEYMISVYAVLVKNSKRDIESLPEEYIIPVAEYLAAQEGGTLEPEEKRRRDTRRRAVEARKTARKWPVVT